MKKLIYIASVLSATLFAVSCSKDVLDLENPNALTSASAYNYEADINAALI